MKRKNFFIFQDTFLPQYTLCFMHLLIKTTLQGQDIRLGIILAYLRSIHVRMCAWLFDQTSYRQPLIVGHLSGIPNSACVFSFDAVLGRDSNLFHLPNYKQMRHSRRVSKLFSIPEQFNVYIHVKQFFISKVARRYSMLLNGTSSVW